MRISPKRSRIAVVGAEGFIGSHLSAKLASNGAAVAKFTRSSPLLSPGGHLRPELAGVEVIFYLAASVHAASAERYPARVDADRDQFTRVLDALTTLQRPPLVVFASTGVYLYDQRSPVPFREDSPTDPRTAYGRAKLRLERELAARRAAVPSLILRLATVYGAGQRAGPGHGVVAHWLAAAAAGAPLRLFGDPDAVRDYVYVTDVTEALWRITSYGRNGTSWPEVINIGSGRPTSLSRLLGHVVSTVRREVTVEAVPGRGVDQFEAVLDVDLAASVLGWRPSTDLRDGISRMWQGGGSYAATTPVRASSITVE
ncbi:NAD-dependent epimerase/dehydratase family protein [Micromonospora sp. NPDC050397]|uniref:NAD-dependent epimerase/dehydratase family protein n=1 Tax=Micromonospora sp. NPDC050397 TaxID=3364279 RepID=UPI0038504444